MKVRTVLMAKNELLALVSMARDEEEARITTLDPRRDEPLVKTYEPWLVADEFKKVLALSEENGWKIVYQGQPLVG